MILNIEIIVYENNLVSVSGTTDVIILIRKNIVVSSGLSGFEFEKELPPFLLLVSHE